MSIRGNPTEPDPRVVRVWEMAKQCLSDAGIRARSIGGLALNQFGAGRPTFDVDFVVATSRWQDAVNALRVLSVDYDRMGVVGEPEPGALLQTKEGPWLEVFPDGITAGQIAQLRGRHRKSPANNVPLRLSGPALINLIDSKLASYLSATDRLKDASDIQELIKVQGLDASLAAKLHPSVRKLYRSLVPRR